MTKEEAIDILQEDIAINKHLIDTLPSAAAETFKNDILAYNMAIKSLEAWEEVKQDLYKMATESLDAECAECYRIALLCVEGYLKEVSK